MNQGTIEVRGQGRATVDPDVAVVALTISVIIVSITPSSLVR